MNILCILEFRRLVNRFGWQEVLNKAATFGTTNLENKEKNKIPFQFLFFEDLVRDPPNEMQKVMKFLEEESGVKVDNLELRLLCLCENLQGSNKRKKKDIDPYTDELKKIINSKLDFVHEVFHEAGMSVDLSSYKRTA